MKIQIGNIVVRTANDIKHAIEQETIRQENKEASSVDRDTFYYLCGVYEARIFGFSFSRAHSCDFIDKITDRYRLAATSKIG